MIFDKIRIRIRKEWALYTLHTGQDAMLTQPAEVAALLEKISHQRPPDTCQRVVAPGLTETETLVPGRTAKNELLANFKHGFILFAPVPSPASPYLSRGKIT